MSIELSKEEKVQIINSHMRTLAFNKYNAEIDIVQENAKTEPNSASIASYNSQIAEIDNQIAALNSELASVMSA